jgi:hypothetical protein
MLEGLEQFHNRLRLLLGQLKIGMTPTQDLVDEIQAWNRLLRLHVNRQRRDPGLYGDDVYQYNPQIKKIERIWKSGVISSTI